MASPHLREDLPFSPADLVLRYSLEQRADYLGDALSPLSNTGRSKSSPSSLTEPAMILRPGLSDGLG